MNIDILYIADCPNHKPAVRLAEKCIAESDTEARVREIEVMDADQARRLQFRGSPTILVDGVDVQPDVTAEGGDFALSCRFYGGHGLPSKEAVAGAIRAAIATPKETRRAASVRAAAPLATMGAVFAAAGASACCWLPLGLVAVGASSAGVSAWFAPLRPYLLTATAVLLAGGFYLAFFRKPACAPGEACAVRDSDALKRRRALFGVAAAVAVAFAFFPSYAGGLFGADTMEAVRAESKAVASITLGIQGMSCEVCARQLEKDLSQASGVAAAAVDYDSGEALIALDSETPAKTEALLAVVRAAGFEAKLLAGTRTTEKLQRQAAQ